MNYIYSSIYTSPPLHFLSKREREREYVQVNYIYIYIYTWLKNHATSLFPGSIRKKGVPL